jgi:hypothetical protein
MPGPFYFAWVDPDEAFGEEHLREDELIYSAKMTHAEGGFAALSLEVRNPRVGLLAPGRKRWAYFAYGAGNTDGPRPIYFGRLVGLPTNLIGEVITLEFIAKPLDYADQKAALAETLKEPPFYDAAFIAADKRDDPDTVLEGYSALWHVDRVTHEVTISDILVGEDGEQEFTEAQAYYDSVKVDLNEPPLKSVTVTASMDWEQTHAGSAVIVIPPKDFETWTGDSFISGWPKPGANIGGGWIVKSSSVADLYGAAGATTHSYSYSWQNQEREHENGDMISVNVSQTVPGIFRGATFETSRFSQSGLVDPFGDPPINRPMEARTSSVAFAAWRINAALSIAIDDNETRKRKEGVSFTLTSDLQAIVTDASDIGDTETIQLTGSVDTGIDVSRSNYFPTDRGLLSIEYLMCLGRARLLSRARAVKVSWDCRFEHALVLSCRKNARLFDPRLPGGKALGKIVEYGFEANGNTGLLIGHVTIGCAIGYGDYTIINPSDGSPVYVDPDYFDGVQQYVDSTLLVTSEDFGYSPPLQDPNVPRFPNLTYADVVVTDTFHSNFEAQSDALANAYHGPQDGNFSADDQQSQSALFLQAVERNMQNNSLWYELVLRPVAAFNYENAYDIAVTRLVVPKMIDLEAPSS